MIWYDASLTFGEMIKRLRTRIDGLTQRKLGAMVGVNYSYISRLENGLDPLPTEEMLIKLAEALEVSKYDLILASGRVPKDFHPVLMDDRSLVDEIIKRVEIKSDELK